MEVSLSRASNRGRAVLLVDDAITTRAPLADLLRRQGHLVLEAASSDEALDVLNSRLDIEALLAREHLQGSMGGLALADWVRRTRPAMHVLVVSDAERTPGEPNDDIVFVTRPVASEALLALLPPPAGDP